MREERKEDWLSRSRQEHKTRFSELDILLRAIDRYFSLEHLNGTEQIAEKNFSEELLTVRDSIMRILGILEVVIPESNKNAYWFQNYAETKYLSTRKIDAFRKERYLQDSPEKSLYLLYDSVIHIKSLITDLIRSGSISYLGFTNIGRMISKEIRENIFFSPFAKDLNPEFDFIRHAAISALVKSLTDREEKKQISLIYLFLFRFLRILSFVEISSHRSVSLNSSLLVLILLRSEIATFRDVIEKACKKINKSELRDLLQSISYQFSIETKRVYLQELKDIRRKKKAVHFRGKIENSHGILKNLTEHSVVHITQCYLPAINGEEIFPSFMTKFEQSRRLREDIFALQTFLSLLMKKADVPRDRLKVFESLKNYMLYFESFTFRLLRYEDYEEFVLFFNAINAVRKELVLEAGFHKIIEQLRHFSIFLETTMQHLGNRAELACSDVDGDRVKNLMNQYL